MGGAEEDGEDQSSIPTAPPSSPSPPPPPPPIRLASPPHGSGGVRLDSIRALSAIGLPLPPPVPKVGHSLLLHLRPGPDHQHQNPTPPSSTSASEEEEDPLSLVLPVDAGPQAAAAWRHGLNRAPNLLLQPTVYSGGDAKDQEDGLVDGQEGAVHTQDAAKGGQFCADDKPRATNGDNAIEKKEVVDTLIKDDQENVLQQCTSDCQLRAASDDQEVVDQDATHPRDDIAVEKQQKMEQDATHELGSTENEYAAEDQEVVEGGVIGRKGESADASAVDDQEKPVDQCATYGLGTAENDGAKDDQGAVEQGVIHEGGATMYVNAVKDHEVLVLSVMEGMRTTTDDIAVVDQEKKVEQCATYDLGTIENDDVVDDQEVVEQGVVNDWGLTMDDDPIEEKNSNWSSAACEFGHLKDVCSTTKEAFGQRTGLAYDNFTRSENAVQQQEQTMYPERPGEPECFHYMRHGYCKFQMNCKYHHPGDRLSKNPLPDSSRCPWSRSMSFGYLLATETSRSMSFHDMDDLFSMPLTTTPIDMDPDDKLFSMPLTTTLIDMDSDDELFSMPLTTTLIDMDSDDELFSMPLTTTLPTIFEFDYPGGGYGTEAWLMRRGGSLWKKLFMCFRPPMHRRKTKVNPAASPARKRWRRPSVNNA